MHKISMFSQTSNNNSTDHINIQKGGISLPRKPRSLSSTNVYHVVVRGIDCQLIFEDTSDYTKYIDFLEKYKSDLQFDIFAYCLMSNHVHLLIHNPNTSLETIFRHLNTAYSTWFNKKYNRSGYLLQGRYYSEAVESREYLLTVIRYIHQNPLKSHLESFPGINYKYSSMYDYLHNISKIVNYNLISYLYSNPEQFIQHQSIHEDAECLDIENIRRRLTDEYARKLIIQECNCATVTEFQSLSLIEKELYLRNLHKKGISIRQLNRLTGIPKGVIDRTIAKHSSK